MELASVVASLVAGLLVNLSPCILPTIPLKIRLMIVQDSQRGLLHRALDGLGYLLGCISAFVALGSVFWIFTTAGEFFLWGSWNDSKLVSSVLAAILLMMALNSAGLFSFNSLLPGKIASHLENTKLRFLGFFQHYLDGVITIIMGTPCAGSMLTSQLYYCVNDPVEVMLLRFTLLGIGVGSPYLLLCILPINKVTVLITSNVFRNSGFRIVSGIFSAYLAYLALNLIITAFF